MESRILYGIMMLKMDDDSLEEFHCPTKREVIKLFNGADQKRIMSSKAIMAVIQQDTCILLQIEITYDDISSRRKPQINRPNCEKLFRGYKVSTCLKSLRHCMCYETFKSRGIFPSANFSERDGVVYQRDAEPIDIAKKRKYIIDSNVGKYVMRGEAEWKRTREKHHKRETSSSSDDDETVDDTDVCTVTEVTETECEAKSSHERAAAKDDIPVIRVSAINRANPKELKDNPVPQAAPSATPESESVSREDESPMMSMIRSKMRDMLTQPQQIGRTRSSYGFKI